MELTRPDSQRYATSSWVGDLRKGNGKASTNSGALCDATIIVASRFEEALGSNPDELMDAAHASCFSMQFAALFSDQGHPPLEIRTKATLTLRK